MAQAVPDDSHELIIDQPLADELARRGVPGVHVGDRVRLQLVHGSAEETLPAYFGSFASGTPDLADRVDQILRAELPTP